jgi:hypothetical protein
MIYMNSRKEIQLLDEILTSHIWDIDDIYIHTWLLMQILSCLANNEKHEDIYKTTWVENQSLNKREHGTIVCQKKNPYN